MSHAVDMALVPCGSIRRVVAPSETFLRQRPAADASALDPYAEAAGAPTSPVTDEDCVGSLVGFVGGARVPPPRPAGSPRLGVRAGAGIGLGYDDLKTVEAHRFLQSVAAGGQAEPGLRQALAVAQVQAGRLRSWESGRWEPVAALA